MIPTDMPFELKRLQFPVRLAFALLTINKAQGQSLQVCGLNFEKPCFSHGQLYVACSCVGKPSDLFVYASEVFAVAYAGHFYNADGTPNDPYHFLHLPHDPPLYPTLSEVPLTSFSCSSRPWGYYADTEAYCQVYHLCQEHIVSSHLCTNGTLFNDQFKVCDQFYNVRCGFPYEDL